MELFEEALRKWEQALNIRHSIHSGSSNNSLALQGATCGDIPMVPNIYSLENRKTEIPSIKSWLCAQCVMEYELPNYFRKDTHGEAHPPPINNYYIPYYSIILLLLLLPSLASLGSGPHLIDVFILKTTYVLILSKTSSDLFSYMNLDQKQI